MVANIYVVRASNMLLTEESDHQMTVFVWIESGCIFDLLLEYDFTDVYK